MRLEIQTETKMLGMDGMGNADFFHVYLEGVKITAQAARFDASSSAITLKQCEFCYQCGVPSIAARKIADHSVVWFSNPDLEQTDDVAPEVLRIFNLIDYEAALNSSTSDLPCLSPDDLRHIIALEQFPDWKEFLYCLPEIDGDETGADTMGLIVESISKLSVAPVIQSVSKLETITFGFDIDNLLETKIDFVMLSGEVAFRFQSNPHMPLWLKIEPGPGIFVALTSHLDNARR